MKYFQKFAHYLTAYREEFGHLNVKSLLEIGVRDGGSLQYWRRQYPGSEVTGIDIDPECSQHEEEHIRVFIGDQTDREFLSKVAAERGPFDVIVDDGGHKPRQQRASFETLWPHLRSPGCYCIEDLNMGYWVSFSGLGAFSGGFMRYAHRLTHLLNGYWHRLHPSSFWHRTPPMTHELTKITFRDSMVFVHKGEHKTPIIVANERELIS